MTQSNMFRRQTAPRAMPRLAPPLALAASLVALTGCARSLVTTTIRPDGSWSRTVKLTAARNDKPGVMSGPSLQQAFVLPHGGAEHTRWERTKDDVSYIAEVRLTPGQAQHGDVVVKSKKGLPDLDNDATVRQVSPGTWEYREVLHWKGSKDQAPGVTDPEVLRSIKQALPAALATDENARAIAASLLPSVWQAIFGPPEPLISQILLQPDLANQLLDQHLGSALDETLRARFGDRLTRAQRWDVTRKILVSFMDLANDTVKEQGQSPGSSADAGGNTSAGSTDDTQPVALTFVVQAPGRIVSTNGDVNPVTHEVFWGLYPEAAALGDVTLTATYRVGPAGASTGPATP